jgi:predicted O-methyltransferase YrrM
MSYEFSCDWFTDRVKCWPIEHLKGKQFNYLEIGSYEGRSVLHIHDNIATHDNCALVCVDPYPEYPDLSKSHINNAYERFKKNTQGKHKIQLLKMDMIEAYADLTDSLGSRLSFDLIYVDGQHLSFEAYKDAQLAWRLLRTGGIMILDDYELFNYKKDFENCATGIDYFLKSIEGKYELLFKNWQLGIKKL